MAEKYITEEQRAGCQKVADAFAELYELTDVVVAVRVCPSAMVQRGRRL